MEKNFQYTRKLHELKNRITKVSILAALFFSLWKVTGTTEFHFLLGQFYLSLHKSVSSGIQSKGRLE
jgi:hypothetical protein